MSEQSTTTDLEPPRRAYVETGIAWVDRWEDGRVARVTSDTDVDDARAAAKRLAEERG